MLKPNTELATNAPTLHTWEGSPQGVTGWLALDGAGSRLCVGGFRVQRGLRPETLARLARAMTLKQHLLGLGARGAKCGLDLDPSSPQKASAMRGFLRWLRPWLQRRYSAGPDLGTTLAEIESLARSEGIPSVKIAAGRAQGLDDEETLARFGLLSMTLRGHTLSARRAGHGLGHAALATLDRLGVQGNRARVGILGFGKLGRGAALALHEAGVRVIAVGDLGGSRVDVRGLPIDRLTGSPPAAMEWDAGTGALLEVPLDVLILAGSENMVPPGKAKRLPAAAVVVGANLGLSRRVEELLHERGALVIPDFVGGAGGSASIDALLGPPRRPTPAAVLERAGAAMRSLAARVLRLAESRRVPPRQAALSICAANAGQEFPIPYGRSLAGGKVVTWESRELHHARQ